MKTKKINIFKIIKGSLFVLVGIIFIFAKFWEISLTVNAYLSDGSIGDYIFTITRADFIPNYWEQIFSISGINWIFSALFFGIGVTEIIEGVKK
ncbi:MAG: hypothetical protein M0R51_13205 [Clostridia bacterium]|jgi:hypothetical protein|nr:hypothetical protein [Clostridia bacterium]